MNAPEQARLRMTVPMEVGICCADLDRMLAFYTGVLGLALVNRVSVPADKAAATGRPRPATTRRGCRPATASASSCCSPPWRPAAPAAGAILDRQGATYLTFIVHDLPGVVRQLQARGVTLRQRARADGSAPRHLAGVLPRSRRQCAGAGGVRRPAAYRPDLQPDTAAAAE